MGRRAGCKTSQWRKKYVVLSSGATALSCRKLVLGVSLRGTTSINQWLWKTWLSMFALCNSSAYKSNWNHIYVRPRLWWRWVSALWPITYLCSERLQKIVSWCFFSRKSLSFFHSDLLVNCSSAASAATIPCDESEVLYYLGYIWLPVTEDLPSSIFNSEYFVVLCNRKLREKHF